MRFVLCLAAAFLVLVAPARAAWTPAALTNAPGTDVEAITSVFGADGTAAVAWLQADGGVLVSVRPPGGEFGPPLLAGTSASPPAVAVGPRRSVALLWAAGGGLMYGVAGAAARLLPGTTGAEAGTFALDAAGNATVAWQPHNWEEGAPGVLALTVAADGTVSSRQTLSTSLPDEYLIVRVAPRGQAAITWSGEWVAYRGGASGAFEAPVWAAGDGYSGNNVGLAFDGTGNLFLAVQESTDRGDERFRTGVRPVGGAYAWSPVETTNRFTTMVAIDPAGGASLACDCGTDGGLHTRTLTVDGTLGAEVSENPSVGPLIGWAIGPDGTRFALWKTVSNVIYAGSRPRDGAWSVAQLSGGPAGLGALAVGPSGESVLAWGESDADHHARLHVAVSGTSMAVPHARPVPTRVTARDALTAWIKQLRAALRNDRRLVAHGRSVKRARHDTAAARVSVRTIRPVDTATRRARAALLRALAHRARGLSLAARHRRALARRALVLATHDASVAARHLGAAPVALTATDLDGDGLARSRGREPR